MNKVWTVSDVIKFSAPLGQVNRLSLQQKSLTLGGVDKVSSRDRADVLSLTKTLVNSDNNNTNLNDK